MISKIDKIQYLGIFSDYQWQKDLPEFKRFNLIYGWNGSGKTTLSQLFPILEKGESFNFPNLKYKICTTDGDFTQNMEYRKKIRVFNRDYVEDNIDISLGKAKPIFILGKENKVLAEAIKNDEKILYGDSSKKGDYGRVKELELKSIELEKKINEKGKYFSDVAKIISTNTSGVIARNYRKNNAEQAFSKLKGKKLLSENAIQTNSLTLKQLEKPLLIELDINYINERVDKIVIDANLLLTSTVEAIVIKRLKDNPDISEWVEEGLKLHTLNKSKNCEFCDQPIPSNRLSNLMAHFNDADKKLKDEIDSLINKIDQLYEVINNIAGVDKANLYDELQDHYSMVLNKFTIEKIKFLKNIITLKEDVEKKKLNTTTSIVVSKPINALHMTDSFDLVNSDIRKHNNKSKNFTQAKLDATLSLENHYLSEIFDNVKKIELEIEELTSLINIIGNGDPNNPDSFSIEIITKRILDNKGKMTTSGPACEEINKQLKTFLGRDELTFEISGEGYVIKRNGIIAKNLSEGEKTAIAFVYFTIHLKDQNFKIKEGIVVIDDPICSMDSNSVFQAFAFLKNAVSDASQFFILTHNFEFLRLLLNWLHNSPKKEGGKEFYMIKNVFIDGIRTALIDSLDPLLREHDSEYQYLFKLLYNFQSDGTIASVYHTPNIARKVLEYFLMIRVPNHDSLYKKIDSLAFDKNKKTSLYKFVNDFSHISSQTFSPSLVQECQNNVKYLLEMMDDIFPEHYKILVESIGATVDE
jgi:wobble nucleotide-excising tRNase